MKEWADIFKVEFDKDYYNEITKCVEAEEAKFTVYPPKELRFSFTICPFNEIKVVILGQDPYHGPGQAHGLCFSVQKDIAIPKSLINIFKELRDDLGQEQFWIPLHGNLLAWAKQGKLLTFIGVLLLNATLTVRKNQANSHSKFGWNRFTDHIIKMVAKHLTNVVFMLWGKDAQKKLELIDQQRHCVLIAAHPSPLSAYRGFFGCRHFSKANEYLKRNGKWEIAWEAVNSISE